MVFEGEMRQSCKTLFTFTRPYFGNGQQQIEDLC